MSAVTSDVRERAAVPVLCAAAAAAVGLAAWLLVDRRPKPAGLAALAAAALIVVGGALLRPAADRRSRLLLSFADRAFDGAVLGSLAWATRSSSPGTAAGSVVAMAAGFLAAYVRARGGSLGYGIEESGVTPALRYVVVSVALLVGWTSWAVWVVAVLMLLATAVRASQVAKEERA